MRAKWILAAALALLVLGGAFVVLRVAPQAEVGAAFVAKQMCSCLFVAGREERGCRLDLMPQMDRVRTQTLEAGVRAWVPLLASRVARFREGSGCTLE